MTKLKIGQKVSFDPYRDHRGYGVDEVRGNVTGTIVLVHEDHRYFTTEYGVGNQLFRISFKFNDYYGPHKRVFKVKE